MHEVRTCKLRERPASAARKFYEYPRRFPDATRHQIMTMDGYQSMNMHEYTLRLSMVYFMPPRERKRRHQTREHVEIRRCAERTARTENKTDAKTQAAGYLTLTPRHANDLDTLIL
ncbi:hypothetical protein EVAR_81339_1 [Eumeta japonica]|uniref:Uncharacterized protein n=1 Tax=Eumeta variegata TaxID=151549 RepID=A0A4C1XCM0_EUMVA|nr:hypothetical protein EVAR_81339_1 [Eumeta japonica]